MALKDILVYVDQAKRSVKRLRLAADLARRHESRLIALYVRELSPAQKHDQSIAELGLGSAAAIDQTNHRIREAIDEAVGRLQATIEEIKSEFRIEVEWRSANGVGSIVVPQHARFADLCILSQDEGATDTAKGYTFSEQLLFVTGRPVVFIPADAPFVTLGRHIVVAWNSSRASARAVNDALPLIERAERVTVLAVNPADFVDRYGALPPERMVEHLRRHGATVEGIWLKDIPTPSIGAVLQTEAHKLDADLLVAGAFGHPKLWEKLMGGVTHDLLANMTLPVLMSY
jgi:nucleotide-binding universal stress UspA family protein